MPAGMTVFLTALKQLSNLELELFQLEKKVCCLVYKYMDVLSSMEMWAKYAWFGFSWVTSFTSGVYSDSSCFIFILFFRSGQKHAPLLNPQTILLTICFSIKTCTRQPGATILPFSHVCSGTVASVLEGRFSPQTLHTQMHSALGAARM